MAKHIDKAVVTQAGKSLISPAARNWLYGLIPAVIALVTFYGVMSEGEAQLWATLIIAFLGGGSSLIARAYTPTRTEE